MARLTGLVVMVVVAVVGCGDVAEEAPPPPAPVETTVVDLSTSAPKSVSVVLENEWVRATRITLEPGSQLPQHVGADRLVYSLSDYTIEWIEGDGAPIEKSWTAGQAHWHGAGPHAMHNIGESTAELLVVERLGAALPADVTTADDTHADMPLEYGRVVLDTDAVRAVEVTLEPGTSTERHSGGHRVVYALSDYTVQWTEGDAEPVEASWSEGQAHWHGAVDHEVENVGDSPARYLVVTFLK
jgi:quercetin dioxygenase-like cupin family protein